MYVELRQHMLHNNAPRMRRTECQPGRAAVEASDTGISNGTTAHGNQLFCYAPKRHCKFKEIHMYLPLVKAAQQRVKSRVRTFRDVVESPV